MSTENINKSENELIGKSVLSPTNRNRTLLLKKNVLEVKKNDAEVSDLSDNNMGDDSAPLIKVTHVKSVNSNPKEAGTPTIGLKNEHLAKSVVKELSLTKNSVNMLNCLKPAGSPAKGRDNKANMQTQFLKLKKSEFPSNSVNMTQMSPDMSRSRNFMGAKLESLTGSKAIMKGSNMYNDYFNLENSKFVPTKKATMNTRSGLFGHEPTTYTTNPLVIEDLIEELEEKAKNYFIMFSKERKEREKLERQCYWMQEENKTLQVTLKNQITTIQGLQNKIIDLRGNPSVITETIERIDMLYTQLDTLIQAFAGICSYITFNEPKDRREIIELVLEYLHPCRGLDLRLNSLYGSIYYFKLGIVKELPPPIQPPEKIPGYDVWQPPPKPSESKVETEDSSKLPPYMQQGNSLSKVSENYAIKEEQATQMKNVDAINTEDTPLPKIMSPVASTKQATIPVNSSQVAGDMNVKLTGFEIVVKSVQRIEPIGDDKGKLYFVARVDSESSTNCKNNPVRRSKEFEYEINPKDGKGSIQEEFKLMIDELPPKASGLLPRFTIDMWKTSNKSEELVGNASKTFVDPQTLLPEQVWDVIGDGEKLIANIILSVNPIPGDSMLPAGRFIVAKEAKNKLEPSAKKENKLSRLSFRGDKEKGIDKMNAMLRPGINLLRKVSSNEGSNNKNKAGSDNSNSSSKSPDIKKISPPVTVVKNEIVNKLSKSDISTTNNETSGNILPKELSATTITPKSTSTLTSKFVKPTIAPQSVTSKNEEGSLPKVSLSKLSDTLKSSKVEIGKSLNVGSTLNKTSEIALKKSTIVPAVNESKEIPAINKTSGVIDAKSTQVKLEVAKSDAPTLAKLTPSNSIKKSQDIVNKSGKGNDGGLNKTIPVIKKDDEGRLVAPKIPSIGVKIEPKIGVGDKKPEVELAVKNVVKGIKPLAHKIDTKPNIPSIKKVDSKTPGLVVKPKNLAPAINIKKQANIIAIKPKVLDGHKNAVTITPKIVATPPKSVLANKAGQNTALGTGKEDIKILVTKGGANITPKIIPKIKIVPKAK